MNELEEHFLDRIDSLRLALEIAREEIIGYKHLQDITDPQCPYIDFVLERDLELALAKPLPYVIS